MLVNFIPFFQDKLVFEKWKNIKTDKTVTKDIYQPDKNFLSGFNVFDRDKCMMSLLGLIFAGTPE